MPLGRARRAYRGLRGLRPQPHRLQLISQPPPAFAGAGYCPKCQGAAATDWLAAREADLLPVGYCHVVFTLPAEIYLARYTHRVAIANSRLVALDARGVTFHYKDYRRNGQTRCRTMTLSAGESAEGVSSHPPLRAAGPRQLQGQHCARQGADGRLNAAGRAAGSTRHSRSGRHPRSSPTVPLLRRPHDHRRGLCARGGAPRGPPSGADQDLIR
jgi:Putative transposase/Transposase zinc-binding domain